MRRIGFILLGLGLLLTACGVVAPDLTETPLPTDPSQPTLAPSAEEDATPTPTEITLPTDTLEASDTPIPSDTPFPSDTPAPAQDLSGVTILEVGDVETGGSFITLGGVQEIDLTELEIWILGFRYSCNVPADAPDQYYCEGGKFISGSMMLVEFIADNQMIWAIEVYMP